MCRIILIFAVMLFISGCASTHMNKGLEALQGEDIQAAFYVLGYPDAKQEFGNDTVYIWGVNRTGSMFIPQTTTTYGNVGSIPVYGQTTSMGVVPVNYNCTIKIAVTPFETIKRWEWNGNQGGCAQYANKLKAYYENK